MTVLLRAEGQADRSASADAEGVARFGDLPVGAYVIVVQADDGSRLERTGRRIGTGCCGRRTRLYGVGTMRPGSRCGRSRPTNWCSEPSGAAPNGQPASAGPRVYSDRDRVPTGVDATEGYTLHDIQVNWTPCFHRAVTFHLGVNNLANTEYQNPRFGTPGIGRHVRPGRGIARIGSALPETSARGASSVFWTRSGGTV